MGADHGKGMPWVHSAPMSSLQQATLHHSNLQPGCGRRLGDGSDGPLVAQSLTAVTRLRCTSLLWASQRARVLVPGQCPGMCPGTGPGLMGACPGNMGACPGTLLFPGL